MTRMTVIRCLTVLAACLLVGCGAAYHKPTEQRPRVAGAPMTQPTFRPTTQPTTRPSYFVSPMQLQLIPMQRIISTRSKTTFAAMGQTIESIMPEVTKLASGLVRPQGPFVFHYHDMLPELNRPFELEVGYPVDESARSTGRFEVQDSPALFAATAFYTGPLSTIDKAYDRIITSMTAAGLQPSNESREIYFQFEGPDSPNNQILIAVGVK